jgi:TPR repeat protein
MRLLNGEGVERDLVEAAKYFKKSADQGNDKGQYEYGLRLKYGEGVQTSLREAARYFKLSADQGNSKAQRSYGTCLRHGHGFEDSRQNKESQTQSDRSFTETFRPEVDEIGIAQLYVETSIW